MEEELEPPGALRPAWCALLVSELAGVVALIEVWIQWEMDFASLLSGLYKGLIGRFSEAVHFYRTVSDWPPLRQVLRENETWSLVLVACQFHFYVLQILAARESMCQVFLVLGLDAIRVVF